MHVFNSFNNKNNVYLLSATSVADIRLLKTVYENTANTRFLNSLNLKHLSAPSHWLCGIFFFVCIHFLSISSSAALYYTENNWFFQDFLLVVLLLHSFECNALSLEKLLQQILSLLLSFTLKKLSSRACKSEQYWAETLLGLVREFPGYCFSVFIWVW